MILKISLVVSIQVLEEDLASLLLERIGGAICVAFKVFKMWCFYWYKPPLVLGDAETSWLNEEQCKRSQVCRCTSCAIVNQGKMYLSKGIGK